MATTSFGGAFDDIEGLDIDSQGRIIAVGTGGTSNRFAVARYLPDGLPDNSFSSDGMLIIGQSSGSPGVVALEDDSIMLGVPFLGVGTPSGYRAMKLQENGNFDFSFGTSGAGFIETAPQVNIRGTIVQPDDKILVGGYGFFPGVNWNFVMTRFLPDGTPDPDFGSGGRVVTDFSRSAIQNPTDRMGAFALQPDGKIVAGGFSATTSAESTGNRILALTRYLPDGSPDPLFGDGGQKVFTFETGTFFRETVSSLAILPDGKILAASGGGSETALFRLNDDGSLDQSFGTGGRTIAPSGVPWRDPQDLVVDSEGRILTANGGASVSRFLPTGQIDTTFGSDGTLTLPFSGPAGQSALALAWQDEQNLIVGGNRTIALNNSSEWQLARITFEAPGPVRTLALAPTFDVKAVPGTIRSIEDGATGLLVGLGFDAANPEERAIFEFPIGSIPPDAVIDSARLELDPYVSSGTPRVEVAGYAGDGLASLSDITASASVLTTSNPLSASMDQLLFDLPAEYVQSLLGNATHVGLRLRSLDLPLYVGFNSSETTSSGKPRLVISYSLPSMPGDFTGDGVVDAEDLLEWKTAFGESDQADADEDGDSDGNDFLAWQRALGQPAGAPAARVPEPTLHGLALVTTIAPAFFSIACRRRRGQPFSKDSDNC